MNFTVLIIIVACVTLAFAQEDGAPIGTTTYPKGKQGHRARYVKEDLPYIACATCEEVVSHLYGVVSDMRAKAPYNRLGEVEIMSAIDTVCTPHMDNGIWTRRIDIQSVKLGSETVLELVEPGGEGLCGRECQTLSKSCRMLFDDEVDRDSVAGLYWSNKYNPDELKDKICGKNMANRCKGKPKYVSHSYKRVDQTFLEMTEKDLKAYETEKMVAEMNAKAPRGEKMKMYSREDMARMVGEDDEDEL